MISVIFQIVFFINNFFIYKKNQKDRRNYQNILNSSKFNKSVSVLIPAWNESNIIIEMLEKLKLNLNYSNSEIIVIAGGTDDTYKLVKENLGKLRSEVEFDFKLLEQKPLGKNNALNQGLEIANGEIIAILDADCFISSDWLYNLILPLSIENVFLTYGIVELIHGFGCNIANIILNYKNSQKKITSPTGMLGCNFAIRKYILKKINGFNPNVYTAVDLAFSKRIKKYDFGKRIFAENAKVQSLHGKNLKNFLKNRIRINKAKVQFWKWKKSDIGLIIPFLLSFYFTFGLILIFLLCLININQIIFFNSILLFMWLFYLFWIIFRQLRITVIATIYSKDKKYLLRIFSIIIFRLIANIIDTYILIYALIKKDVWKGKKTFDQER